MMKKFLINVFIFCIIFITLNLLPHLFLNPYYGNEYYSVKYEYFTNNQDKFNTVILGSSRLYRQMNPKLLDNLLTAYQTSTFNLAASATNNPEVYYLYEKLLESIEVNTLKYAFVELGPLHGIAKKNLNTSRNYYWHNLKYLNFSISYTLASNMPWKRKRKIVKKYIHSYFNKVVDFFYGYKRLSLDNKSYRNNPYLEKTLGKRKNGFYPLEEQMHNSGHNNAFKKRLRAFLKDTSILKKRALQINKSFSVKDNGQFINEVHLAKIIDLIEKSKQKGVHLIFIISPGRMGGGYNQLLAIKEKLPKNHIIEVANPKKYPELYQVQFQFDRGHLNTNGANVFTQYIANELIKNVFSN